MKPITIVILALSFAGSLNAQAPARPQVGQGPQATGTIRGTIVDGESNTPISAASVAVWSKPDSALITGAIAQKDGSFRVEGLKPGAYYLKLTMIGYASLRTPVLNITAEAPTAALGAIKLTKAAVEVAGVTATADRQLIIAPDRNAYRVKDVAPAAANASEVLDNIPAVNVDADGKVSYRGNENVVVQINGRPTPIRGAQLAGFLKTMPANTIDRVELIPNPSAKQDPEGMAGIINIVMKQGVDLGTSGGFTAMASTQVRQFFAGNIGHQSGPIALNASYGFNRDFRDWGGINDRQRLTSTNVPLSFTEQDLDGRQGNYGHNASFNLDYTLSKKNVLGTTFNLNRRFGEDGSNSFYDELNANHQSTLQYYRLRENNQNNWLGDGLMYFKRTMVPQKKELSTEVRFNVQDDYDHTDLWREAASRATRSDAEINQVDALTKSMTAQLDYTTSPSKVTKLEIGYKGNLRWMDRDYDVSKSPTANGVFTPTNDSNSIELDESINAAYAVLSKSGKKFDLQGGLRAEYATRDFTLTATGVNYPHNYSSLFPSGLINYKMNDKSQLKLSYSRRVRRPGNQELNPFPVFFDLQNVFFGNPALDPEYTSAVELGYQRSGALGTLQISPFYRYTSNIIRVNINTADTLQGREITSISFENLDHSSSWGSDVNAQIKPTKTLSLLAAFNVFKMVVDGGSASALQSNAVTWSMRYNATWNVSPATTLLGAYFYRAPQTFEKGSFTKQQNINVALRQKLSQKFTGTVRVIDPFNWSKFGARVNDQNIFQATDRSFDVRGINFNLQYAFGQTPRLRQRNQEQQQGNSVGFGGN
jgi:ferric enterobactin receptor